MPTVSAVLFDWDGTLADSFATTRYASLSVFEHFGIRMDEARYQATYRPDWHETYRQLGIPESRWDEAGAIWSAKYLERRRAVKLFPDALRALRSLSDRKLRLGVVTSADRQRFHEDLHRLGLADRFDALVAFEDTQNKKPHPEGLLLALSRLGVEPRNALYVGDRPEDVAMGKSAGTLTAAIVSNFSNEAMLRSARPDVLLPTIADLPGFLPAAGAAP
ncbi:MAG: HAD-IA family hydrolase [Acidobacteriota bacterium]|nr:HAD-IA family hydrolase [Acidobacteriota bacterium]MXW71619.1 HAD-IA family hydrolase [Acidobacteriota bacterium]MXX85684.1 HAD-IA family hydrolase [Acidobacteriota bacterium]MYE42772.1 HAD-IA family hydrolase [Acidobacteriota bacterium]MYF76306.1 HAD-IA family hydrolase [Acidobacteriota bacterium]